jgi:hypothetical protein
MENFYSWMIKPVSNDDVEIWFNMNNMVPEKRELFSDFTFSLYFLIRDTYLGDEFSETQETKVILSQEEKDFNEEMEAMARNARQKNIYNNHMQQHQQVWPSGFSCLLYCHGG